MDIKELQKRQQQIQKRLEILWKQYEAYKEKARLKEAAKEN